MHAGGGGGGGWNEECDWATIQDCKGHILDTIYLAIFSLFDPANKVTQNNDSTDNSVSPASRWAPEYRATSFIPVLLLLRKFKPKKILKAEMYNRNTERKKKMTNFWRV